MVLFIVTWDKCRMSAFFKFWMVYVYVVCCGHIKVHVQHSYSIYVRCISVVFFKVKNEEEKWVRLISWDVFNIAWSAQWYVCSVDGEKYIMFISLDDTRNWVWYHTYMNHTVNVCSLLLCRMKGNFVVILMEGHPGLKRLYSNTKTKPAYYTNTRDCLESPTR
jgi:hypothetical protein